MLGGITRALPALPVVGLLLLTLAAPAHAQDGGLVVVAETRYRPVPEEARVAVSIQAVATSFEPDTPDAQVYYSGLTFALPAGASNVAASSGGVPLTARIVEETDDFRAVEVTFSRGVFYRQSYAYTVTFDLADAGGAGDREVRVGRSIIAFPVWAFGTEEHPGSSVRVELPAGYEASVAGSGMALTEGASGTVLTAEPADPFAFFAYVSADRPGAFSETPLEIPMRERVAEVLLRAWEDDPGWATQMADLLEAGLPALEESIGVPYPQAGELRVEEAAVSRLGDYAGLFDPQEATIHVRYDADAFVALHEAAHVWFNDRWFDDRWINEAWAEWYAIEVGEALGATGFRLELSAELLEARIPLNDWGAVGREDLAVEDFAYAATYELAGLIAGRTDPETLRAVWRAADSRELAYLPADGDAAPQERASLAQPGWQRLLDLLEERSGTGFADLWAEWVVNGEQHAQLAERASVRTLYAGVRRAADDWELPGVIRIDLGAWRFDEARDGLRLAEEVLGDRDRIEDLASGLGLEPSGRLQAAFEGEAGLLAAAEAAEMELAALAALRQATDRLAGEPSVLEAIGLLGTRPEALLGEAQLAYEAGDSAEAAEDARAAAAVRAAAAEAGRSRVTLAASLLLAVDGAALATRSARRPRRGPGTLPAP